MTSPANQRKLDVVEELAQLAEQAGLSLIELAIAFVINHPGVTAAIVGPRTMEQLETYLPAADITLSTDVLDRIDQLVAPGVTVNPDDNSYGAHELTPHARRRAALIWAVQDGNGPDLCGAGPSAKASLLSPSWSRRHWPSAALRQVRPCPSWSGP